jgi:hypothetical protein
MRYGADKGIHATITFVLPVRWGCFSRGDDRSTHSPDYAPLLHEFKYAGFESAAGDR